MAVEKTKKTDGKIEKKNGFFQAFKTLLTAKSKCSDDSCKNISQSKNLALFSKGNFDGHPGGFGMLSFVRT